MGALPGCRTRLPLHKTILRRWVHRVCGTRHKAEGHSAHCRYSAELPSDIVLCMPDNVSTAEAMPPWVSLRGHPRVGYKFCQIGKFRLAIGIKNRQCA